MRAIKMLLPVATVLATVLVIASNGSAPGESNTALAPKGIGSSRASVRNLDLLRFARGVSLVGQNGARDNTAVQQECTFWVASGEEGEYYPAATHLAGTTERFRVWVENGTELSSDLMIEAVRTVECAMQSGLLAALNRAATTTVPTLYPVDIVFAHMHMMGGYFSSADQSGFLSHPYGNRTNAIYVSLSSCNKTTGCSAPLIGHELQHLLQYQLNPQEATWVNEGLSELVSVSLVAATSSAGKPSLRCSDIPLLGWSSEVDLIGQHYSATKSFLSYWRDTYGETALEHIATSPLTGQRAFEQWLAARGEADGFDSLFLRWAAREAVTTIALLKNTEAADPSRAECIARSLHTLPTSGTVADTVSQYGCDYIVLTDPDRAAVSFYGEIAVPVVPVQARSGAAFWWSDRVPQAATTLTRPVDLSSVTAAHLEFWIWYDLEEWYDWAYAAVSEDGGQTWHLLASESTTAENPTGNNPGIGFTGKSYGWMRQTVDLSAFAGKAILLRFGCLTDDAVEEPGFALDDISIAELGFLDSAETWDNWDADGFKLVSQSLPQRYAVVAVTTGADGGQALDLPLGQDNTGNWVVPPTLEGSARILAVCGLTESTAVPSLYCLTVSFED